MQRYNDFDFENPAWVYSSEVFVNTNVEHAVREANRRRAALEKDGYEAVVAATSNLGGWLRGFAVYYREKQDAN